MPFKFTAVDARGMRVSEVLDVPDVGAAQAELLRRGLMVMSLEQTGGRLLGAAAARKAAPGARTRELALFARQMSMMLRAGASVVPALTALREQPGRPRWHALLADLCERVEAGNTLHDALSRYPAIFPGTMRTVVAAGEATGTLGEAFARVSSLIDARLRVRKTIGGALVYPAMLLLMAIGVTVTMTMFVLPRFTQLFKMLNTPVPALTQMMLDASDWAQQWWLPLVLVPLCGGGALLAWMRSAGGRTLLSAALLRIPVIGRAIRGVLLASLLNIWAALLRSRVPLLEAVREARDAVASPQFRGLIDDIEQAILEGRSLASVLKNSSLVPAPIAATLHTGEESGKLGESMEFVAAWLEEDNDALIKAITKALEPGILILMGGVVGTVCVSLFLPLFDIATAAG